jgi:hypothetical protein
MQIQINTDRNIDGDDRLTGVVSTDSSASAAPNRPAVGAARKSQVDSCSPSGSKSSRRATRPLDASYRSVRHRTERLRAKRGVFVP